MQRLSIRPVKWIAAAVFIAAIWLACPLWLPWIGRSLVYSEEPVRADIVVVLAGDSYGHRILKGADLVKEGFARKVLVSGPSGQYGFHESDLAIFFALKHGYPSGWFLPAFNNAVSTYEEAQALIPELRRLNVHRYILVTSDYHTRRARRVFRKLAPDLGMVTVAAPDEFFRATSWWRTREGRKTVLLEWSKTIGSYLGM